MAEKIEEEHTQRLESLFKKENELLKTLITREQLDGAVAYALTDQVDYKFALDLQGNMYRGRSNAPMCVLNL